MIERVVNMVRAVVTRGKIVAAAIGARTVTQVSGLDNETLNGIELLLPPGYSARPSAGADVLLLQVLGSRDHMVALGGDFAGVDMIAELAPGEFGLRHATGARIVFRATGHVQVSDPSGTALELTNNGTATLTGDLVVTGNISDQSGVHGTLGTLRGDYNAHTHPDPQGGSTGTTSAPTP